jgi:hypothetical protein
MSHINSAGSRSSSLSELIQRIPHWPNLDHGCEFLAGVRELVHGTPIALAAGDQPLGDERPEPFGQQRPQHAWDTPMEIVEAATAGDQFPDETSRVHRWSRTSAALATGQNCPYPSMLFLPFPFPVHIRHWSCASPVARVSRVATRKR